VLKLYDKIHSEFKLNEIVTFVGILEVNHDVEPVDSSIKNAARSNSGINEFSLGEAYKYPWLHVITYRRNHALNRMNIMNLAKYTLP
jgi:hypothetical protein